MQFTVGCSQVCFGPYQDEAGGVFKDDGFELKSNPTNCGKLLALAKLLKSFLQEGSKVRPATHSTVSSCNSRAAGCL